MEPVVNKLQEGVKYPRFERDATKTINDLVEHITKERGVYSSSIEPNPNEHKVWFNTNDNTLNIYENGKWNTISGQNGDIDIPSDLSNITKISMNYGVITGIHQLNINPEGFINHGNNTLVITTGSSMLIMPYGGKIGLPDRTIKISDTTIVGSKIEANRIDFISGDNQCLVYPLSGYLTFSEPLADMTLSHSIDLNYGSISGLTSIKTLSYTGLTIEPYDLTSTGTPIKINGGTAGLSINGLTYLSWSKGKCYGNSMNFTINSNTITSYNDTFNLNDSTITLTRAKISGTINASGATISDSIISGGTINGGTISGATIKDAIIDSNGQLLYGNNVLVAATGSLSTPILIPNGGNIGIAGAELNICGVTLTGGDFTKLKNLQ